MSDLVTLSAHALALASDGSAPEWVQLTPTGPELNARDGRHWRLSDPDAVVRAFEENRADLPIDVDHATHVRGEQGLDAPSYGWIKEVQNRAGALWGRVEWTQQGAEWVRGKAYRYISPSFGYHPKSREMTSLASAALTNKPALVMPALARDEGTPFPEKETPMLEELLSELGLAKDVTKADALAAIASLKTDLAHARSAPPDAERYVPRGQYDAAAEELALLRAADKERTELALANAVTAGIEAGKIAPALREDYASIASDIGLERFERLVDGLPVLAMAKEMPKPAAKPTPTTLGLDAEELAMARALGQSAEAFLAAKKHAEESDA